MMSDVCVLCKGKHQSSTVVSSYYSEHPAHLQCIEEKSCVYCGASGMCVRCGQKDCGRTFHPFCLKRYFSHDSSKPEFYCDQHRKVKGKRKEYSRLWQTRQVSNRALDSVEVFKKIKEDYGEFKESSIFTGSVFWYVIGTLYFPNFIRPGIPKLKVKTEVSFDDAWDSNLDDYLAHQESLYLELKQKNREIFNEISCSPVLSSESFKDYREEDIILSESRNLLLKGGFEEYMKYFESKVKDDSDSGGNTEKRIGGLKKIPKNEEDFVCSICGDGDYEDDDLIVICSSCEIGAHMKCYGIPIVPETDWNCHACVYNPNKEDRHNLRCALCPVKGGCIKPTIHRTTGSVTFPNYPEGKNEQVWVHIFCATHLESGVFKNKENLTEIDLSKIDAKRFMLKCQVCKTKDGACLQCQHGRCQIAFHPECGKDFFTNTRDKTGYDEVNIYCSLHKPLKLRRILEHREKKCVEDVFAFSKVFERYEKKIRNPVVKKVKQPVTLAEKPFSYEEKEKLIRAVEKEIKKIAKVNDSEFSWIIKQKSSNLRNCIEVIKPSYYNLLDPIALIHSRISIPGRKFMECYKYYAANIYKLLKEELVVMNVNSNAYVPKSKVKSSSKKDKRKVEKICDIQTKIEFPLINDILSSEVYCICRKPFVEKSCIKPWESEADYRIREFENRMVQCEKCGEWFHYKCIGIKEDSVIPELYNCTNCEVLQN